ncbi:MAG TPA: hypothetical protein VJT72_17130, partial [Pseudonocardiaceae bacterium]|nr:hypothetical protein [Pseudonocardiaceae bacterium]
PCQARAQSPRRDLRPRQPPQPAAQPPAVPPLPSAVINAAHQPPAATTERRRSTHSVIDIPTGPEKRPGT